MKLLYIFIVIILCANVALAKSSDPNIAVLISGYGNQGDPDISYDLEELAQTYLVLQQNGMTMDIISPDGGKVPVPTKKDNLTYIQQFKQQTPGLQQLNHTLSAKQALAKDYQALLIIGGDGAMFDLPIHKETQSLIKTFILKGKPMAAVCHGPAALVNVKYDTGEYFLKGKRVNSFTLKEEQAFSGELIDKFPFMLQATIESRGAQFVSNAPMLPFVAEDELLITAQNPMSVAKAAEALLLKMGVTPVQRDLFKDEATLDLINRARVEGPFLLDVALAKSSDNYDMNYLALYGFYAYSLAETPQQQLLELRIMERIGVHFQHPQYALGLVRAYQQQGFIQKANDALKHLKKTFPEFEVPETLKSN